MIYCFLRIDALIESMGNDKVTWLSLYKQQLILSHLNIMTPIIASEDIPKRIKDEGLKIWVCSHGGCATHLLADYLDKRLHNNGVKTAAWQELLVHLGTYVHVPGVKVVYIYSRDLRASLETQKRRGVHELHYKMLCNDSDAQYTDLKMLQAMAKQRDEWCKNPDVFSICYEDMQRSLILLERYLDMRFYGFPEWRGRRRA